MYQVSLRLDHELPFSNLSKEFPAELIHRWCNLEVDIMEIEASSESNASRLEKALKSMLPKLHAKLIHVNRYSPRSLETVIGCKCAVDNSTISMIEASNCIPVMPVSYEKGYEYCKVIAFSWEDVKRAMDRLSSVSKVEIESKSIIPRQSARSAMTIPLDEFLGSLTRRQLQAFLQAMEMGYYDLPKRVTIDEIASSRGVPRSTFEEHLRKAELKILEAVKPYARIAYLSNQKQLP